MARSSPEGLETPPLPTLTREKRDASRLCISSFGRRKKMLSKQTLKNFLFSSTVPMVLQRDRGPFGHWCWEQGLKVSCSTGAGLPAGTGRWARTSGQGSAALGPVPQSSNGKHGEPPHLGTDLMLGLQFQQHLQSKAGLEPGSCQHSEAPELCPAQVEPSQAAGGPCSLPQSPSSPRSSLPACICGKKHPDPGRSHCPWLLYTGCRCCQGTCASGPCPGAGGQRQWGSVK